MDYRHASMSRTPNTLRTAPAGLVPAVATASPRRQPPRQQPPAASAVSQIVDITLPSPISAKAALRMVQTTVKTLMYMRGLLSSPWEQLEMLVKMDQQEQEEQEQEEQEQEEHDLDHALGARDSPSRSIKRNPSSMKPLQEFLEAGEKMFTTLEEAVYDQLYQQFKQARAPQILRTAFSDATTASMEPISSSPLPPPQSPVVLSLTLIFGTTMSTPKEQYMIHIGPLKPLQPLLSATTSSLSEASSNDQANDENETDHEKEEALRNQLQRLERQWERRLVQGLMGIQIMDNSASTSTQDPQQQQAHFLETGASTLPKTKVLLLMKTKSGQIIGGMLPKLALDLQEDFAPEFSSTLPPSSSSPSSSSPSSSSPSSSSSSSSTAATSKTAEKLARKKKRWPIHHIRVMGPRPETLPDNGQEDDIWYQVGPGLPSMPNLK
ncbi:hypothetical protein BG006_005927 [Podila minutissima]|uniref:Uncharacterized protein n=1 Tax=Podila minutissima TaxID=64525 RepID=A0A9P5SWG2_9FUNG|nr:hypothetical protein BG006_005927 [Podila minutissima]